MRHSFFKSVTSAARNVPRRPSAVISNAGSSFFAELLEYVSSIVPGRLLAFLHGPEEGGASQLLTAKDGWDFLATAFAIKAGGA